MLEFEQLILFCSYVIALALAPGLAVSGLIYRTLQSGPRAALNMSAGLFGARLCKLLLVLSALPLVQMVDQKMINLLCLLGAGYLIWSAFLIFRAPSPFSQCTENGNPVSSQKLIICGFCLSWGNPKTILFVATIFPQFLMPESQVAMPISWQFLLLGSIWLLANLMTEVVYILAARAIRRHVARFDWLVGPAVSSMLLLLAFFLISDTPTEI